MPTLSLYLQLRAPQNALSGSTDRQPELVERGVAVHTRKIPKRGDDDHLQDHGGPVRDGFVAPQVRVQGVSSQQLKGKPNKEKPGHAPRHGHPPVLKEERLWTGIVGELTEHKK